MRDVEMSQLLEQMYDILTQCLDAGDDVLLACRSKGDSAVIRWKFEARSRLFEDFSSLVGEHNITPTLLLSNLPSASRLKNRIEQVLKQNQALQEAASALRREAEEKLSNLASAQRATVAYGRWHPVRMLVEK